MTAAVLWGELGRCCCQWAVNKQANGLEAHKHEPHPRRLYEPLVGLPGRPGGPLVCSLLEAGNFRQ